MKLDNLLQDLGLAIAMMVGAIITWLKLQDNFTHEMTKIQKIRKLVIGCVGSCITVLLVYELLTYFNLPPRLATAVSALFGYIGGDVSIKLILTYIEKFINKKIEGSNNG